MKYNRLIACMLAGALAALSFQSCLFEQEDLFDKSASERLSDALENAQKVLQGPSQGWLMYYYPDNEQLYGGYNYIVKFSPSEATVWSENIEGSYSSTYRMGTDDGPVLSFDSFNYGFHYFATPSGGSGNLYGETGMYQAHRGDFEFVILSATPEEVRLKGKRSGCLVVMVPFSGDPEQYISSVNDMIEQIFVSSFDGTIGGEQGHIFLDLSNRQAYVSLTDEQYEGKEFKMPYMYTDKGIRLYKPVEVGTHTVSELVWEADTQKLLSVAGAADAIDLVGTLPEGWHAYDDYLGNWTLTFNSEKNTMEGIVISQTERGKSFTISGLSDQFDVVATYNLGTGKMTLLSQIVGKDENNYDIRMASWDSKAGYVNYGNTIGFTLTFGPNADGVDDASTIYFADNRVWGTYVVSGFILYRMSGSTRIGNALDPWLFRTGITNPNRLASPSKLTRAN